MSEHKLGATDARMEQDEFQLTPVGWREFHGKRDARDMDPRSYTTPTRAIHEPDSEVVQQTKASTLGAFGGGDGD